MKYSNIALKLLAFKEYGIIKSNAQFWKEYADEDKLNQKILEIPSIESIMDKLSNEFDSSDYEGGFICIYDDDFPIINKKVKNNSEKPYLLFYKGDLSLLSELNRNVAVIGLLNPSEEIVKREAKIVQELVDNGLTIVSGLAKGCDTVAHNACLEKSGKTIAILPTQLNKIYPAENKNIAEEIVNKGGLLVSEYHKEPIGRNGLISRLVERDRLQAMFAKAVILIASYRKGEGDSGSRHAMSAAKTYGIARYAMFNIKTDEDEVQFGLNKDLLSSKDNVKILKSTSIGDINVIINQDLTTNQNSDCTQQSLDMFTVKLNRYVFDLDNTLIRTNSLNNNAYNYALSTLDLPVINSYARITRDIVFKEYPNLSKEQKELITQLKQDYFINHLQLTSVNEHVLKALHSQSAEHCILWTSADKVRVQALLTYYKIDNAFNEVLFSDKNNTKQDIEKICKIFKCNSEELIFYEDNHEILERLQKLKMKTISA
jgi:DNA processing protein